MNDRFFLTRSVRFAAPSGDPVRVIRQKVSDNGRCDRLVDVGTECLQDFIESFKDEVDFNRLVERYRRGDISVLSRVQGVYGDISAMPKTYTEAVQAVDSVKRFYDMQSADFKAKYPTAEAFMSYVMNPSATVVDKEVSHDET